MASSSTVKVPARKPSLPNHKRPHADTTSSSSSSSSSTMSIPKAPPPTVVKTVTPFGCFSDEYLRKQLESSPSTVNRTEAGAWMIWQSMTDDRKREWVDRAAKVNGSSVNHDSVAKKLRRTTKVELNQLFNKERDRAETMEVRLEAERKKANDALQQLNDLKADLRTRALLAAESLKCANCHEYTSRPLQLCVNRHNLCLTCALDITGRDWKVTQTELPPSEWGIHIGGGKLLCPLCREPPVNKNGGYTLEGQGYKLYTDNEYKTFALTLKDAELKTEQERIKEQFCACTECRYTSDSMLEVIRHSFRCAHRTFACTVSSPSECFGLISWQEFLPRFSDPASLLTHAIRKHVETVCVNRVGTCRRCGPFMGYPACESKRHSDDHTYMDYMKSQLSSYAAQLGHITHPKHATKVSSAMIRKAAEHLHQIMNAGYEFYNLVFGMYPDKSVPSINQLLSDAKRFREMTSHDRKAIETFEYTTPGLLELPLDRKSEDVDDDFVSSSEQIATLESFLTNAVSNALIVRLGGSMGVRSANVHMSVAPVASVASAAPLASNGSVPPATIPESGAVSDSTGATTTLARADSPVYNPVPDD